MNIHCDEVGRVFGNTYFLLRLYQYTYKTEACIKQQSSPKLFNVLAAPDTKIYKRQQTPQNQHQSEIRKSCSDELLDNFHFLKKS